MGIEFTSNNDEQERQKQKIEAVAIYNNVMRSECTHTYLTANEFQRVHATALNEAKHSRYNFSADIEESVERFHNEYKRSNKEIGERIKEIENLYNNKMNECCYGKLFTNEGLKSLHDRTLLNVTQRLESNWNDNYLKYIDDCWVEIKNQNNLKSEAIEFYRKEMTKFQLEILSADQLENAYQNVLKETLNGRSNNEMKLFLCNERNQIERDNFKMVSTQLQTVLEKHKTFISGVEELKKKHRTEIELKEKDNLELRKKVDSSYQKTRTLQLRIHQVIKEKEGLNQELNEEIDNLKAKLDSSSSDKGEEMEADDLLDKPTDNTGAKSFFGMKLSSKKTNRVSKDCCKKCQKKSDDLSTVQEKLRMKEVEFEDLKKENEELQKDNEKFRRHEHSFSINARDIKIPKSNYFLGQGGFGKVYQCFIEPIGPVALKRFILNDPNRDIISMKVVKIVHEISMTKQNHPNIVRLLGQTYYEGSISLVLEYMEGGNLCSLLQNSCQLPWLLRVRFAYDIASGVAFLHKEVNEHRITHGDLKTENVLMTEMFRCKICDFGGADISRVTNSKFKLNEDKKSRYGDHTPCYTAPERVNKDVTKPMDVYSYGMILYMIITRKLPPFSEKQYKEHQPKVKNLGENQRKSVRLLENFWKKCTSKDPKKRPTIIEVRKEIEKNLAVRKDDLVKLHADVAYLIKKHLNKQDSLSKNKGSGQEIYQSQVDCITYEQFLKGM